MSANGARAAVLERALRAGLAGDLEMLGDVCTDDVRVWTPVLSTSSLAELTSALADRDPAFSDVELAVVPLDVGGEYAGVEWTVEMVHTGTIDLGDDRRLEPSGIRVVLHGATVAEFEGERICSVRQYWDGLAVLEQLGALARDRARPNPTI